MTDIDIVRDDYGARHRFTGDPAGGDHRADCWCYGKKAAVARIEADLARLQEENEGLDEALATANHSIPRLRKLAEGSARKDAALQAIIDYTPPGFISPMDDEDSMNYRAIARAALKGDEVTADPPFTSLTCACGCLKDAHHGPEQPCDGGHFCGTWWPALAALEGGDA